MSGRAGLQNSTPAIAALGRLAATAVAALSLAGCAATPRLQLATCAEPGGPAVQLSDDGQTAHLKLDVLTYNIEGLGPPARFGRSKELAEIGRRLADLRRAGEAPDVIVFQEVFSGSAAEAVQAAGYPSLVAGPGRRARRDLPALGRLPGRIWDRGELGVRFASSGLTIVSRYPITVHRAEPFGHHACAGLDCLSNKGALFAEVQPPGAPDPLQVFDSHLNSGRHARVGRERAREAHRLETQELAAFLGETRNPAYPSVLAGDFNMRHSPIRFAALDVLSPMTLVHRYCLDEAGRCDVRMSWNGATPWMETEDLQYFQSGARVTVRPTRVQPMFGGGDSGPALSDHTGLRVTYDLSWPAAATRSAATCPATPPQQTS